MSSVNILLRIIAVAKHNMVKPKKHLGQHFLIDTLIAEDIVNALGISGGNNNVVEIGPGTGVLTQYLLNKGYNLKLVEIDHESVDYLKAHFEAKDFEIVERDFLGLSLNELYEEEYSVIGNFPYNISSQLFFKFLEDVSMIPEVVCMLQKEVAERLCSPPGSKKYGILSVLLQVHYELEYLFTVEPEKFNPPPKVKSGVIRLTRKKDSGLSCSAVMFKRVVKASFNNRRKTLRNALKSFNLPVEITQQEVFNQRAEQLSHQDFEKLTCQIEQV